MSAVGTMPRLAEQQWTTKTSLSIDTNGSTYSVVHIFRLDVSCLNSLLYSYVALMHVTSPFESTKVLYSYIALSPHEYMIGCSESETTIIRRMMKVL